MAKYSICITHLNNGDTIEASMASITGQIGMDYEVVVVDQGSTDGSLQYLERLASEGKIILQRQKRHNRGAGRQLAFEKASGEYIISNMDMDDTFRPFLKGLVAKYHSEFEGSVLRVKRSDGDYCGVTIFPRGVLKQVGGWRDLNWFEDVDIWIRCQRVCPFAEISYPVFVSRHKRKFTPVGRVRHSYVAFREGLRVGISRKITILNWPLYVVAWVVVRIAY